MINRTALLADAKALTATLVDDLRERSEADDESRVRTHGTYERARSAGRSDKSFEEWREDLLAQVAAGWVLASVFVRFCEDNDLVDTPLLSGPGRRGDIARDHRAEHFRADPTAGDRDWLVEVFYRYQNIPAAAQIFGERNPLWQLHPSADGARAILEAWWARDDEGRELRHNFTDPDLDTRFLGDLYQDLSEHARKQYALLQTPDFVETFILDRTLEPALAEFGLVGFKMIDPTCGSGHLCLGSFERLFARWREREPGTGARELVQRALDAVNGIDVNPFAVEIARFRLLVAALRAAGERRLADLPAFTINLAVGDSLLHGTRPGTLLPSSTGVEQALLHHYPTEDAEAAERILVADNYHAVCGNPPYITVKDSALNAVYRALYDSCHRQYSLAVPFKERFFQLAVHGTAERPAGYVGMITANSFMKREFGSKVIKEFLPTVDLTHVIDTSNAEIPGHDTPTVILFGRDRAPVGDTVRAVLGIRGEPGRPEDPAQGLVWSSIRDLVDKPGAENDFVSVEEAERERFTNHPWSLQGGAAPDLLSAIGSSVASRLGEIATMGRMATSGDDPAYERLQGGPATVQAILGDSLRDWRTNETVPHAWTYTARGELICYDELPHRLRRDLWSLRTRLLSRKLFGVPLPQTDLAWYEWRELRREKWLSGATIAFPLVATHNNFVLLPPGSLCRDSAPVIKLPEGAREDAHLELLGLLNSSAACFWMKQTFFCKGRMSSGTGGIVDEEWEPFYEFDSTKLKQFPLPSGRPGGVARLLDGVAQELSTVLPAAMVEREPPTRTVLDATAERATALRRRMVALQEELDWRCYGLYGLTDDDLTFDVDSLPALDKGERAFEIALTRRMAAGEATSTWFERHGSTPIAEIPSHWPVAYRDLVQRRLDLIESDRGIRLLERPEYKRRWNWDDLADLERDAQRSWLLDRIEAIVSANPADPAVTTCARIADALVRDEDAVAVANDLSGAGVDLVALVTDLAAGASVPFLAAWRLTDSGLRKRAAWERTWALQRVEDALEARTQLPNDDPQHLSDAEHAVARKEAGVDKIPVPPKYAKADFRSVVTWTLRGKLDVPKERFIAYPGTRAGADTSPVVGWAAWDSLQQARALAGHYTARKSAGAEVDELVPLLAGVDELVPWLLQWHDEPDPRFGERMGQFFDGFVATEAAGLGVTREELPGWRPPAPTRGRRRKA
jgi:hypothetical protein